MTFSVIWQTDKLTNRQTEAKTSLLILAQLINSNCLQTAKNWATVCKSTNNCTILTNLQLNVLTKVNCFRYIATKVQGFGPWASHTGGVRTPVINGGKDALTAQSTPI